MIANILLFTYLALIVSLWGHYGLFSAFLHLLVTIVAGALAWALWEPLVLNLLIKYQPHTAWGVGLLGPFILLLIVIRVIQDRLVRTNMRFENLTSMLGGGFCGFLIGVLTSGMILIGVGMFPVGASIVGYQPMTLQTTGGLEGESGKGLLLPVDKWAGSFFTMLSRGSFAPSRGQSMAALRPGLVEFGHLNRLHPDPHASQFAHPESVSIQSVTSFAKAELTSVIDAPADRTDPLLVVTTVWRAAQKQGTYDSDGGLRVAPAQVRLVSEPEFRGGKLEFHAPVGVVSFGSGPGPEAVVFDDERKMAYTKQKMNARLIWVFRVSADRVPKLIFLRNSRFELPEIKPRDDKEKYAKFLGLLFNEPESAEEAGNQQDQAALDGEESSITPIDSGAASHSGAIGDTVERTDELVHVLSMHDILQGFHLKDQTIFAGKGELRLRDRRPSPKTKVARIYTAPDEYTVRIKVEMDRAASLFGQIKQIAAGVGYFYLEDSLGNQNPAIGYVWFKQSSNTQYIHVDRLGTLDNVSKLPIRQLKKDDEFYLYFSVPRGPSIRKLIVSNEEQEIRGIDSP